MINNTKTNLELKRVKIKSLVVQYILIHTKNFNLNMSQISYIKISSNRR